MKRPVRWWWVLVNGTLAGLLAIGVLAAASFSPSVDLMARVLRVEKQLKKADVIVAPSSSEVKDCSHHKGLLVREEAGAKFLREGFSKSGKLIITGEYVDEKDPKQMSLEACRKKLAGELGIPVGSLVMDNRATSTYENAVNTQKIMQTHEWHDALLVTDDTHMFRAWKAYEKQGVTAYPATIPYPAWRNPNDGWFGKTRVQYLRQFLYEYGALAMYKCYGYI